MTPEQSDAIIVTLRVEVSSAVDLNRSVPD